MENASLKANPALAQPTSASEPRSRRRRHNIPYSHRVIGRDILWVAAFLLPFLVMYIAFTLWPLFATGVYSLYDWDGNGPLTNYVGLDNYLTIIQDGVFWISFRNTLVFAILNTVIKLPLSLGIAILLTQRWLWMKRIFRTVFFAPLVIPVAMAGLIFSFLMNPAFGAINDALTSLGIVERPVNFLGADVALLSLTLVSVWQILGQYMIYWIAALQNVPEELYEAAAIDGATGWDKLIHITLPIIRPVAIIILFLSFVNALKVFGLVVAMRGPGTSTYVVSYFIYNQAFQDLPFRYGYASAAAVLFGVTVLIAVATQGYFVRRASSSQ